MATKAQKPAKKAEEPKQRFSYADVQSLAESATKALHAANKIFAQHGNIDKMGKKTTDLVEVKNGKTIGLNTKTWELLQDRAAAIKPYAKTNKDAAAALDAIVEAQTTAKESMGLGKEKAKDKEKE